MLQFITCIRLRKISNIEVIPCFSDNMDVQTVIRQTANGPVEGIERMSVLGRKYYAFRGVPYAEPPITGPDRYTGEEVDRRFKVHLCSIIESNFQ